MKYNTLVLIKQRFKKYRSEFDMIWMSRQFLRRLVKAEFRVAENKSDSAPFSIAKFPQKLSISNFLFFIEKTAFKDAKSEMHFCKGKSRYLGK